MCAVDPLFPVWTIASRDQTLAAVQEAAARVHMMVREGAIISASGKRIPVAIDTVCVHGDNPAAVAMAEQVRDKLERAGVTVRPMAETIR